MAFLAVSRKINVCCIGVLSALLVLTYTGYQMAIINQPVEVKTTVNHPPPSPSSSYLMDLLLNESLPIHETRTHSPMLTAMFSDPGNDQLKLVSLVVLDPQLVECWSNASKCPNQNQFNHVKMGMPAGDINLFAKFIKAKYSGLFYVDVVSDTDGISSVLTILVRSKEADQSLAVHSVRRLSRYWYISKFIDQQDAAIPIPKLARYKVGQLVVLGHERPGLYSKLLRASKLMDCNHTSAAEFAIKNKNYTKTIAPSQFEGLSLMQDKMYDLEAIPFLCGGTLLGWYRECSLIPYTSDLDIGIKYEEWSHNLSHALFQDERFSLWYIMGEVNDSLEYTAWYEYARIDIFLLYHDTSSYWVGGMIPASRKKLRYNYPLTMEKPCAAVLLNHLFHIPCSFKDYLTTEYGPDWLTPILQRNYIWFDTPKNVKVLKQYSEHDWDVIYRNTTEKMMALKDL